MGAMMATRYAEVAVDAPLPPERTLTYAIPPGMSPSPGQVVWAPLLSRHVSGVIFALSDHTEIGGVRPLGGLQDHSFALTAPQLALARWLSRETLCSLYEAAALMLPWDFRRRLLSLLRSTGKAEGEDPSHRAEEEVRLLGALHRATPTEEGRLVRSSVSRTALRRLLREGLVVREWRLERPRAAPQYRATLRLAVSAEEAQQDAADLPRTAVRARALLEYLASTPSVDIVAARKEFGTSAVATLERRSLVTFEHHRRLRDPLARHTARHQAPLHPTPNQASAIEAIASSLQRTDGRTFLLLGVTGSGKTEVYLQALARCVAQGRRGLYLVPEIALTPQLTARLLGRFPGRVGSPPQRAVSRDSSTTPGGAFTAVISTWSWGLAAPYSLPVPDLGLVILDEEHEWTYKQQDLSPRYHARDVALKLAELTGATVVMGSATPDLVTHHRAWQGQHQLLELPQRLAMGDDGRPKAVPLPKAQIVDMREELKAGVRSIFSRSLQQALDRTLERGEQAILFLNRRGASGIVQCRDCGHVLRCRSCDVPLTLPRSRAADGLPPLRASHPPGSAVSCVQKYSHPLPWPRHAAGRAGGGADVRRAGCCGGTRMQRGTGRPTRR